MGGTNVTTTIHLVVSFSQTKQYVYFGTGDTVLFLIILINMIITHLQTGKPRNNYDIMGIEWDVQQTLMKNLQ